MKKDCNPFSKKGEDARLSITRHVGNILKEPVSVEGFRGEYVKINGNNVLDLIRQAQDEEHKGNWGNAGVLLGELAKKVMEGEQSALQMHELTMKDQFDAGWVSGVY